MSGYWLQLGDATSSWWGSALSYTRDANESISAGTIRRGDSRFERFIDFLLGEGHCAEAKRRDELRAIATLVEAGYTITRGTQTWH